MIGPRADKRLMAAVLAIAVAAVSGLDWGLAKAAQPIDRSAAVAGGSPNSRALIAPWASVNRQNNGLVSQGSLRVPATPAAVGSVGNPTFAATQVQRPLQAQTPQQASRTNNASTSNAVNPGAGSTSGSKSINNTELTYKGSWEHIFNDALSQGKFQKDSSFSELPGDTATLQFSGSSLSLMTTVDKHHGIVAVSINGGPETMVDLYSPSRSFQQKVFASSNLGSGTHTATFRVTGQKNTAASGNVVTIDRIDVLA